jgi:hypothetical protein
MTDLGNEIDSRVLLFPKALLSVCSRIELSSNLTRFIKQLLVRCASRIVICPEIITDPFSSNLITFGSPVEVESPEELFLIFNHSQKVK